MPATRIRAIDVGGLVWKLTRSERYDRHSGNSVAVEDM